MASVTITLKVPALLLQALRARSATLGFKSLAGYILSLVRYDIICQGEHTITAGFARATGHVRDKIDGWLLRLAERGVGKRGVLLNHLVERIQVRRQSELSALSDMADEDAAEWCNWTI
jgi:hypothetical protein